MNWLLLTDISSLALQSTLSCPLSSLDAGYLTVRRFNNNSHFYMSRIIVVCVTDQSSVGGECSLSNTSVCVEKGK